MTEDEMYDIIRDYEDSERDYHERNIELEAENVKLRRLARYYVRVVEYCGCCHCPYDDPYDDDEYCPTETEPMREGCRLCAELRELGIELG